MSLHLQRVFTYGPVVNYGLEETWTGEVRGLYKRLEDGDFTALAPLISIDIGFLSDSQAMRNLEVLKFAPEREIDGRQARRELRRIANVIERRPVRRGQLPYGDFLLRVQSDIAEMIKVENLLSVRRDTAKVEERVEMRLGLRPTPRRTSIVGVEDPCIDEANKHWQQEPQPTKRPMSEGELREARRWKMAILRGVIRGQSEVRSARSWALNALERYYGFDRKVIEKRIDRDPIARAMKRKPFGG